MTEGFIVSFIYRFSKASCSIPEYDKRNSVFQQSDISITEASTSIEREYSENASYEKVSKTSKCPGAHSETTCQSNISGYLQSVTNSKNQTSALTVAKSKEKILNSLKSSTSPRKLQETNESIPDSKQRKKRKRDINKEHITTNTETSNAADFTNSKKRLRKLGKTEDDYDIFMDNLLNQMRKMGPLDILEPLLHNNQGICNMYGFSDLRTLLKNKENANCIRKDIFKEQNEKWVKITDFYGEPPFGAYVKPLNKKQLMHNDFYDQEFLAETTDNVKQKFCKLINKAKIHNTIDSSAKVFSKNTSNLRPHSVVQLNAFTDATFPGLVIINDDNFGRQSPVIPLIAPAPLKFKSIIPGISMDHPKGIYRKRLLISEVNEDEQNLTVILTISSNDILSVFKDLANILNISPISSYKIIEGGPCSPTNKYKQQERQKTKYYNDVQNILNGVKKLCKNCGLSASKMSCVPFVTKDSNELEESSEYGYFCSKACYINLNYQVMCRTSMDQHFKKFIDNSGFRKLNDSPITSSFNLKKRRFKYFKSNNFPLRSRTNTMSKQGSDFLFHLDRITDPYIRHELDGKKIKIIDDKRRCSLCNEHGDGISNAASRLLNISVDKWVHLNCALWSNGVYETISGGLMNVETALQMGKTQICCSCHQLGATIKCFKSRCDSVYHLLCAKKEGCIFYKNKSVHCRPHTKSLKDHELPTLEVQRRVFIERDDNHHIINIMQHQDLGVLLRIGSIILLNIGKLIPQLDTFHNTNCIYPIGYKSIRFYWSLENPNTRCRYVCSTSETSTRPEFTVRIMDVNDRNRELRDLTPNLVWLRILETIMATKKNQRQVKLFPKFISGDDLFGFTEPFIVRIIESLPGVETLSDYRFKYARSTLLEIPLGIHSSGAARTEPQQRQVFGLKKPHTQRTTATANHRLSNSMVVGEVACPYSKQFVHSKSSQYKKMNQEWRNNVYLARSKIQGLGLFAARDLEKHTMVIEYIGEVIRTEVSEMREKQYGARNRGIYMFRLDEDRIVDATLSGGLARYINHSCNPNCVTEIVDVERELRIIIFAKRRITRGEELSYDYKFDIEDDAHKILCMCGALNCRKWMN